MCTQDPIISQFSQFLGVADAPKHFQRSGAAAPSLYGFHATSTPGSEAIVAKNTASSSTSRPRNASEGQLMPPPDLPPRRLSALRAAAGVTKEGIQFGASMSPCTQSSATGGSQLQLVTPVVQEPEALCKVAALEVASELAKRVFGWHRLRLFQRRAIEAWATNRNCFLISGTGSGKTGGFVLPSLVARCWHIKDSGPPPVAIVVSPLVSLMRDQVQQLRRHGVEAVVCSPQCPSQYDEAWQKTVNGEVAICYISPEMLIRYADQGRVSRLPRVSLFAVDEAHCVSEWGFHFRPEYGELCRVVSAVASAGYAGRPPPTICVTATCTVDIRADIMRSLNIAESKTDFITNTMNRPNIHYSAEEYPDLQKLQRRLLELFGVEKADRAARERRRVIAPDNCNPNVFSTTVVYAWRKKDCDDLASLLENGGVKAAAFHSNLVQQRRHVVQDSFLKGDLQVVVATIAFGMGIDKPNVRRVIHYGVPTSLEAYAQESGRGGRDGGPTRCVILYTPQDRYHRELALLGKDPEPNTMLHRSLARLYRVIGFVRDRCKCRRLRLLAALGQDPTNPGCLVSSQKTASTGTPGHCEFEPTRAALICRHCDVCCGPPAEEPPQDLKSELYELLQFIAASEEKGHNQGHRQLVEAMVGKGERGQGLNKESWVRIVDEAVWEGFLEPRVEKRLAFAVFALTDGGRERAKILAGGPNNSASLPPFLVHLAGVTGGPRRQVLKLPSWAPAESAALIPISDQPKNAGNEWLIPKGIDAKFALSSAIVLAGAEPASTTAPAVFNVPISHTSENRSNYAAPLVLWEAPGSTTFQSAVQPEPVPISHTSENRSNHAAPLVIWEAPGSTTFQGAVPPEPVPLADLPAPLVPWEAPGSTTFPAAVPPEPVTLADIPAPGCGPRPIADQQQFFELTSEFGTHSAMIVARDSVRPSKVRRTETCQAQSPCELGQFRSAGPWRRFTNQCSAEMTSQLVPENPNDRERLATQQAKTLHNQYQPISRRVSEVHHDGRCVGAMATTPGRSISRLPGSTVEPKRPLIRNHSCPAACVAWEQPLQHHRRLNSTATAPPRPCQPLHLTKCKNNRVMPPPRADRLSMPFHCAEEKTMLQKTTDYPQQPGLGQELKPKQSPASERPCSAPRPQQIVVQHSCQNARLLRSPLLEEKRSLEKCVVPKTDAPKSGKQHPAVTPQPLSFQLQGQDQQLVERIAPDISSRPPFRISALENKSEKAGIELSDGRSRCQNENKNWIQTPMEGKALAEHLIQQRAIDQHRPSHPVQFQGDLNKLRPPTETPKIPRSRQQLHWYTDGTIIPAQNQHQLEELQTLKGWSECARPSSRTELRSEFPMQVQPLAERGCDNPAALVNFQPQQHQGPRHQREQLVENHTRIPPPEPDVNHSRKPTQLAEFDSGSRLPHANHDQQNLPDRQFFVGVGGSLPQLHEKIVGEGRSGATWPKPIQPRSSIEQQQLILSTLNPRPRWDPPVQRLMCRVADDLHLQTQQLQVRLQDAVGNKQPPRPCQQGKRQETDDPSFNDAFRPQPDELSPNQPLAEDGSEFLLQRAVRPPNCSSEPVANYSQKSEPLNPQLPQQEGLHLQLEAEKRALHPPPPIRPQEDGAEQWALSPVALQPGWFAHGASPCEFTDDHADAQSPGVIYPRDVTFPSSATASCNEPQGTRFSLCSPVALMRAAAPAETAVRRLSFSTKANPLEEKNCGGAVLPDEFAASLRQLRESQQRVESGTGLRNMNSEVEPELYISDTLIDDPGAEVVSVGGNSADVRMEADVLDIQDSIIEGDFGSSGRLIAPHISGNNVDVKMAADVLDIQDSVFEEDFGSSGGLIAPESSGNNVDVGMAADVLDIQDSVFEQDFGSSGSLIASDISGNNVDVRMAADVFDIQASVIQEISGPSVCTIAPGSPVLADNAADGAGHRCAATDWPPCRPANPVAAFFIRLAPPESRQATPPPSSPQVFQVEDTPVEEEHPVETQGEPATMRAIAPAANNVAAFLQAVSVRQSNRMRRQPGNFRQSVLRTPLPPAHRTNRSQKRLRRLALSQVHAARANVRIRSLGRPLSEYFQANAENNDHGRKRARRERCYSAAQRATAPPLIAKLMEAADFDSNLAGGSKTFKRLLQEAKALGTSDLQLTRKLDEVLKTFQSKTKSVHGLKIDEIIDELRSSSR